MRLNTIAEVVNIQTKAYRLIEGKYLGNTLTSNHESTGKAGKGIYVFFRGNYSVSQAANIPKENKII